MGMYTEFYFRAELKNDPPLIAWLSVDVWESEPFDQHEFFTQPRWRHIFDGAGAVYQFARPLRVQPKEHSWQEARITISSSLKHYGNEIDTFLSWIHPYLEHEDGEFLGYSLYEDSYSDHDGVNRERPIFYYFSEDRIFAVQG